MLICVLSPFYPREQAGKLPHPAQDTALMLSTIAGPDPRVPIAITEAGSLFRRSLARDFEGVRIAMKSCYYITVTGLPAISVPCGFTSKGLPVGVQIVGRHQDDWGALQLAWAFEQATDFWQQRPPVAR